MQGKQQSEQANDVNVDDERTNEALLMSMLTGFLEKAVNQALRQDAEALKALQAYAGHIIRIKTYQPYAVMYCQFCDEGVLFLTHYDGEVDARVQIPAGKLLMAVLHGNPSQHGPIEDLKILGDRELVENVWSVFQRYDLWRWVRQWCTECLPGLADRPLLMDFFRIQAPEWWMAFLTVPTISADVLLELKHASETQTAILAELKALREAQENRSNSLWRAPLGGVCLAIGLLWLVYQLFL
ncbi:MAG: SCP2 sterol-binding domain-containing protein [Gammaproteobacteria bacterium]